MEKLEIKICTARDLELLEKHIPTGGNHYHLRRYQAQMKGLSTYLIAWLNNIPVGHLNLKWHGADEPQIRDFLPDLPEINALGVWPPKLRSLGIGRKLVRAAEDLVKDRDYRTVGLGVELKNTRAQKLYETLGYKKWNHEPYEVNWPTKNADGSIGVECATCLYMIKDLS